MSRNSTVKDDSVVVIGAGASELAVCRGSARTRNPSSDNRAGRESPTGFRLLLIARYFKML